MLEDAVKAGLPLISLKTRDMINFELVVKHLTGKEPHKYSAGEPEKDTLYYMYLKGKQAPSVRTLYKQLAQQGSSLILINADKEIDAAFDCGELETPKELVRDVLTGAFSQDDVPKEDTAKFVESMLPALGGLTLKEIAEVVRLTQVREESVTPRAITKTRQLIVPTMQGLSQINTDLPVYIPNPAWGEFVEKNKPFFVKEGVDHRLVPRGALLDGEPGTGKTQGAKYLANQWGVPLYRMAADFQSKWVGESEGNLQRILNQAAQEAPCVLLIDEVEKLFSHNNVYSGSGGSMSKTMSLLLWFMQESHSKVFVCMTCNNKAAIPPELYREGRIAGTITFVGLRSQEAYDMADEVLKSFKMLDNEEVRSAAKKAVSHAYSMLPADVERIAHSKVNEIVVNVIKEAVSAAA